jgi:hypothetical protein
MVLRTRRSSTYEIEGRSMFVTVIHRIHDPEGCQAAEAKALEAGLPSSVALPIHAATSDHTLGICIWEGESVGAVREVVESAVGPWANNEYYQMHVEGLTPQLGASCLCPVDLCPSNGTALDVNLTNRSRLPAPRQ